MEAGILVLVQVQTDPLGMPLYLSQTVLNQKLYLQLRWRFLVVYFVWPLVGMDYGHQTLLLLFPTKIKLRHEMINMIIKWSAGLIFIKNCLKPTEQGK